MSGERKPRPSPEDRARGAWEDRHGSLARERDRWRRAAMASLGLAAVAVGFGVWAAVSTEYVPYIVSVDALNRPAAALAPREVGDWPDAVVRHELAAFLRDWRSVSLDRAAMEGRFRRIQYFLERNSAADLKVIAWARDSDTNPFRIAETRTSDVDVVAVNQLGGRSWLAGVDGDQAEPDQRQGRDAAALPVHLRARAPHRAGRRGAALESAGNGRRGFRHREGAMSVPGETAGNAVPAEASTAAEPAAPAAPVARPVSRGRLALAVLAVVAALAVGGGGGIWFGGRDEGPAVVNAPELNAGDVDDRAGNLGAGTAGQPPAETATEAGTGREASPVDTTFAARLAEEEARLEERARQASDSPLSPPVTGAEELVAHWRVAETDAEAGKPATPSPVTDPLPAPAVLAEAGTAPPAAAAPLASGPHTHVLVRGSVIPAVLESSIDSDLPGLVRAKVAENVFDTLTGRHLLVPKGSWLVGTYGSGAPAGRRRLFVSWTDLLLPDGTPVPLGGTASLGADGASGVRGRRSTGIWSALGAAVLFDLAGNASQILVATETGQAPERRDGLAEILGEAVGSSTSQVGQEHLRELLDRGTRFRVAAGARMNVVVEESMHLPARPARGAW